MRIGLERLCGLLAASAVLIAPAVAAGWEAGSVSIKWKSDFTNYFDGVTTLSIRQDAIGAPGQTRNCNRDQVKSAEILDAKIIPATQSYSSNENGAIVTARVKERVAFNEENNVMIKTCLVRGPGGRGDVCAGNGSVDHIIGFYDSKSERKPATAVRAPSNVFAQSSPGGSAAANPTPAPKKGSWQAALLELLPDAGDGKDGGRVTGVKLDETPRTIANYAGAGEIEFADKRNVSVFLFNAPRKDQTDGWVVATLSDLSPLMKGKGAFSFTSGKIGKLQWDCLRKGGDKNRVDVVCGIFDTQLPLMVTVAGGYPGREGDKIPTATLESLINRLNLALNLIIDKALD